MTPQRMWPADALAGLPDVAIALDIAAEAAGDAVDPALLELCRHRLVGLLGGPVDGVGLDPALVANLASWPSSSEFTATQRACLGFTEQFAIDVASLDGSLVDDVRQHLGDGGAADFVRALLVVEQRMRLALTWQAVLV